jgi:hypothetical protein
LVVRGTRSHGVFPYRLRATRPGSAAACRTRLAVLQMWIRLPATARPCFNRPVGELVDYGGGQPEQWLATIGDISISQHWVMTPTGPHPIRGSVWTVTDMSHYQESISAAGIVLAIVFIWFCLLSLLFLLMKDRRMVGSIQVTVQGSGFHHSTMIPATSPHSVTGVHQMVNYARTLAAAA